MTDSADDDGEPEEAKIRIMEAYAGKAVSVEEAGVASASI